MAYVVPIHRPSSVRRALKLRFLDPEEECLVVAKANRLEIYSQIAEGLVLEHSKAIYGKVIMLQKLRPASATTDHLFIGTNLYTYFTVSWDAQNKQLRTEQSYVDQADKASRDSMMADRCHLDPSRRYMTLEIYEGIITVIPVFSSSQKLKRKAGQPTGEVGTLGEPTLSRIEELFVRSSAFLQTAEDSTTEPRMALLYQDNEEKVRLKVRKLQYIAGGSGDVGQADLIHEADLKADIEMGASHLIPVPSPLSGLLILGETSIMYVDQAIDDTIVQYLDEATVWATWAQVDNQRWLLGDDYGKLYFLMLLVKNGEVEGWRLDYLGETSRAFVFVYLDGGHVYVGSHNGDSQVIRIIEGGLEIVQTFPNISPILDFTIMDLGSRNSDNTVHEFSSGQARIVTGSGAFKDGTLRSVRSGVGMEELGVIGEMQHIVDLWSLQSTGPGEFQDTLLVSFVDETRIFHFNAEAEVEEVDEFCGLILSQSTLLVRNIPNSRILQVTETDVRISDLESGMVSSHWTVPDGSTITAASANNETLVFAVRGKELQVVDISGDLQVGQGKPFASEIAGVTIPESSSKVCIVSFWQNAEICIFSVKGLRDSDKPLSTYSLGQSGEAVPRSVMVTQILPDHPPTLFVAMADGTVVTFTFNERDYSLSGINRIVLGSEQVSFKALPRGNGLFNVFATCEQPSLIYSSEGRIIYSAVNSDKASRVCHFNPEAYPGAIAIATSEDLKIALVDTERTTQLQTMPVYETPRRIAYSAREKAFGIGSIRREVSEGAEIVKSHLKLADEVMFRELDSWEFNEEELVESLIRVEVPEGVDDQGKEVMRDLFVAGTSYADDTTGEPIRGRILVFEATKKRTLRKVTELSVKGACRALAMCEGRLVAGLTKTVVIYALQPAGFGAFDLNKQATYRTSTAPLDISVSGSIIAIADLMKSISIVRYTKGQDGDEDTLHEVARHFATSWSTSVTHVDTDTFLEADAEGNLLVLHQNVNGVTEDDRRRLEVTSEIHLGEQVNRIRAINVPVAPGKNAPPQVVIPRAFMATVDGGVYLFCIIAQAWQDLLMRLQSELADRVKSPGHMPWRKWRGYRTGVREAEEPFRFVDGELVERFLDCKADVQGTICQGLGRELEEVRGVVEGLRRLH